MNLECVPLLRVMRELQSIPRGQPPDFNGMKRFRQYLRTIFDYDKKVCKLPVLLAMNPMGKDHVTALLDAYLAMDGDGIGARATAEASARLADVPGISKWDSWSATISWAGGPTATFTSSASVSVGQLTGLDSRSLRTVG